MNIEDRLLLGAISLHVTLKLGLGLVAGKPQQRLLFYGLSHVDFLDEALIEWKVEGGDEVPTNELIKV